MGWLSNVWNRSTQFAGKAIGTVGGIAKRVGSVGSKVLGFIGQYGPIAADVIAAGALATGNAPIAAAAEGAGQFVRRVADWSRVAKGVADNVSSYGGVAQGIGRGLQGGGGG